VYFYEKWEQVAPKKELIDWAEGAKKVFSKLAPENDPKNKAFTLNEWKEYNLEYVQFGFDTVNVLPDENAFPKDLVCNICHSIPNDPSECITCRHSFCKFCLKKNRDKCPFRC